MPVCSSGRRQRIARGPRPSCGRHSGSVARPVPDRCATPRTGDHQAQRRAQAKAEAARPRPHWRRASRRVHRRVQSVRPPARARLWLALPPAGRPAAERATERRPITPRRVPARLRATGARMRTGAQRGGAGPRCPARRRLQVQCRVSHGVMARWTGSRRRRGGGSRAEPSSKNFPCGGRRSEAPSSGAPAGPRAKANASPSRG